MSKLTKVNTGSQDNSFVGCAITGSCNSAIDAYVKTVVLSDGDAVSDGMIVVITFSNGNTAGNAPGTKTIYSSDQINYYEDVGLTIPFTLAPEGCYELEYTGTGNAYTYQSYPVLSIGDVTGPVCDYRGHKTSGSLWEGGDEVQCMYKNGKFLLLGGSSASSGDPVGTIIALYKKSAPAGYLYLDGSTFDTDQYPALYMYLGDDTLPDYREFALVGAEENTTDVYNASTNPTGTIHDHDVYTEGQAKDDQLQDHSHTVKYANQSGSGLTWGLYNSNDLGNTSTGAVVSNARKGTVTRGKRKAVYFYIKATAGLNESQQEDILNETKNYSMPRMQGEQTKTAVVLPTSGQTIALEEGWYSVRANAGAFVCFSQTIEGATVPFASAYGYSIIMGGVYYFPAGTYTVNYSGTIYFWKLTKATT